MDGELVQFLRDRLNEDEQIARAATQGDWVWSREFVTPPGYHHRTIGPLEPGDAVHIARHNPARVLAEVDAKRRLLELHGRLGDLPFCATCDAPSGIPGRPQGCDTIRLLALTYADHPDYRSEWRS